MTELSKAEKLLRAAGDLADQGHGEFSAEDLVVAAFRLYPNDFSLKGYSQYPNSNYVLTQLMGKHARMIVKGWFVKTGTNTYRLTPKGFDDLAGLQGVEGVSDKIRLDRQREEGLGRLLTSSAYHMFQQGRYGEVTFHQFCRFLGLAAPDKWQRVQGKLSNVRHLIDEAVHRGEAGEVLRLHFRGKNPTYSPDDLRLLGTVYRALTERFKPHMDEWERKK